MSTAIGLVILSGVLILAIGYLIKQKKKGVKCVGCPMAECCSKCKSS